MINELMRLCSPFSAAISAQLSERKENGNEEWRPVDIYVYEVISKAEGQRE
jgi:hypothetical protein